MLKKEKKNLKRVHHLYHLAIDALHEVVQAPSTANVHDAYQKLSKLNKVHDLDFDNELIDLKKSNHYRHDTIAVMDAFNYYMLNHVEPDTKTALAIVNHCLKPLDYTSHFKRADLADAFRESYYYFAPCGDVSTLRYDLIHGNYFNLKGDLKTIKSNREDLLHESHTGNIKKFMGKPERDSVKRHNESTAKSKK